MRRFLAILSSLFHSSLLYTFPAIRLHQLFFLPPSIYLAICFLVFLLVLLFPNSYTILFWEFYFLAILSSFFHSSLLYTFSCHSSPPTIFPSSLTSSCHLFIDLPLGLVDSKFIYNTLLG